MKFEPYCLFVRGAPESEDGYVSLAHGSQYILRLYSFASVRSDVEIAIDGKFVGCWRLESQDMIDIERPVTSEGRFTFFRMGTREAEAANLRDNEKLGLITATFWPERIPGKDWPVLSSQAEAGGTGLTGRSEQKFGSAVPIVRNLERMKAINLRLIEGSPPKVRALAASSSRSTPVPPPIPKRRKFLWFR